MTIWTLRIVVMACAMSIGGCQFSGGVAGLEQQLPGALTATETIAINTLILRYQELQRLKMVLDGMPVPALPPLPPGPSPVPVVIVPPNPPGTPPVVVTPIPGIPGSFPQSPPVTPSLRQQKRHGDSHIDQMAATAMLNVEQFP